MSLKYYSLDEVKAMDGKNGNPLWVLIEGNIYDLTHYDHPGGKEVLDNDPNNYEDMYEKFEDAGHSPTAIRVMSKYLIGILKK